ncbi:MAG: diguanylate cyclase, partial [Spirochaetia bacterium]
VNPAFEKMTGYSFEEVKGKSPRILQGPKTDRDILDNIRSVLKADKVFHGTTTNYRKDGSPYLLELTIEPYRDNEGQTLYYLAVQRDITQETAERNHKIQLQKFHEVSQKITSQRLELDLIRQKVATVTMEITNAEAAVVEEPEEDEMVYRAAAGKAEAHLGLRLKIDKSISGLTFRSQKTIICRDSQTDERVKQKKKAKEIGFCSAILAPLLRQDKCYGVLKVYSSEIDFFHESDKQLIELSSNLLASSLFNAAAFDEEVKKRKLLLDAVPILIGFIDNEWRYREANEPHEDFFQKPLSEIRGKKLKDILIPKNYDRLRPYLRGALKGERVSFEIELLGKDGKNRTFHGNLEPHITKSGTVEGCYFAIRDITNEKLAEKDYLTGLLNRRKFEELASYVFQAADRKDISVSLIMMDIDHFKQINDTYGHPAGDSVLKDFSAIIMKTVRKSDIPCRWGGDEVCILLRDVSSRQAEVFADRLLGKLRNHDYGEAVKVTASIGIAELMQDEDLMSLQKRADNALYKAKQEGGNRISVSS